MDDLLQKRSVLRCSHNSRYVRPMPENPDARVDDSPTSVRWQEDGRRFRWRPGISRPSSAVSGQMAARCQPSVRCRSWRRPVTQRQATGLPKAHFSQ
jgi:hypothetical protein